MTAQDVKLWLMRGFWLRLEKEQISRMRQETFTRLTKVTQDFSGVVTSGTKDPHKYDVIAELDADLAEKEAEIEKSLLDIYKAISSLRDDRLRFIMLARYYEGQSWQKIIDMSHYSDRQIYRLHGTALMQLIPYLEKKNNRR